MLCVLGEFVVGSFWSAMDFYVFFSQTGVLGLLLMADSDWRYVNAGERL